MFSPDDHRHLSHIDTIWPLVRDPTTASLQKLLHRYGHAVHRYLLGATRDLDAADELFQEFALRLVRGDFGNADPKTGRFRDYLKTALCNLIADYQKRRQREQRFQAVPLQPEFDPHCPNSCADEIFLKSWRYEILSLSWQALEGYEQRTKKPFYTVLHMHSERPGLKSPEAARLLSDRLHKSITPQWVRKWLYMAREKFADLVVNEVSRSLGGDSSEHDLEEELLQLGVAGRCRGALQRRAQDIWN